MSVKLDKAAILGACDRKVIEVEVPEWGGSVHLRSLSLGEGIAFQATRKAVVEGEKGDGNATVLLLLAYTLCDERGEALLDPSEVDALRAKNPLVLMRLFEDALALNKMGRDSETEEERGNE